MATSKKEMKILSLGMPRTGTLTLKQALETLGYGPLYHGLDMFRRPQESVIWNDWVVRKYERGERIAREDLDRVLEGYEGVMDMSLYVWEDLLDAYPDAKIILVERDITNWYNSYHTALIQPSFSWSATLFLNLVEPLLGSQFVLMGRNMLRGVYCARSQAEWEANAHETYRRYYADVRAEVARRRRPMLEYGLREGWGPLCEFLGAEVPEKEFPRANEERAILEFWEQEHRVMARRAVEVVSRFVGPALLVAGAAGWFYWRRMR